MTQARETTLLEVPLRGELGRIWPRARSSTRRSSSRRGASVAISHEPGDRAYLLYVGADRIARVVLARSPVTMTSPIDGVAEEVTAEPHRAAGLGYRCCAVRSAGGSRSSGRRRPRGRCHPDAELRSGAVDISAAGSILVAGARLDIEALTRARAIGVAGIICGGVVGRELQQLEESDVRQRAALHALTPFADPRARRLRSATHPDACLGPARGGRRG